MNKNLKKFENGLYLICSTNGQIVDVLFDDFGIVPEVRRPTSFFDILDKESISKSSIFWSLLQDRKFVPDYELLVEREGTAPLPLKFSAGIFKNHTWVIAVVRDEDHNSSLEEMILMNNEQQNIIRRSKKKFSELHKSVNQIPSDSYDELSKVNNELVNAQRNLAKQNEEILQLNRQLEKSNKELEHFAYLVAHDLKEPLRMVRNFMGLLKKKYSGSLDEKALKYIHFAVDGAQRMTRLIDDLLEYSRVGRVHTDVSRIDLNELIKAITSDYYPDSEEGSAVITATDLPVIKAVEISAKMLFQNLISNALKYRDENRPPKISISYEDLQTHWKFCVKDNGIGIEGDYLERIFDIFERLHANSEYSGTGMGLAICKKIVEQHGGKIWVESVAGEGSRFYFTVEKISVQK